MLGRPSGKGGNILLVGGGYGEEKINEFYVAWIV